MTFPIVKKHTHKSCLKDYFIKFSDESIFHDLYHRYFFTAKRYKRKSLIFLDQ